MRLRPLAGPPPEPGLSPERSESPTYTGHYPPIGLDEVAEMRRCFPPTAYTPIDFSVTFRCRFCRSLLRLQPIRRDDEGCMVCGAEWHRQRGPI